MVGGLEKVCLRLAQNFQHAGHEVEILGRFSKERHSLAGYFSESEEECSFEFQGITVRIISFDSCARFLLKPVFKLICRKWTFPIAKWLYVAALKEKIAKTCRGADVVHFLGNGLEMLGFAAEAAARQVGAKFVIEPALHEGQWGDKWFDALLYKRADLLLAHSRHEAGVLERMGIPAAKIQTIVHGVDVCDSGDGERFRDNYGITGAMVLFLGRKTKEKGLELLLKAWPIVAEKFPEAMLVIAGPKNDALRLMADGEWRMADGGVAPEDRPSEAGFAPHGPRRSKIGDEVVTTNHTNRHENGNGDLTTEDTESTTEHRGRCEMEQPKVGPKGEGAGATESKVEAWPCPGSRFGASESGSLASKLAESPVSESLTRSASGPASSLATSYSLPVTAPAALSRILNLDDVTEEEKQDALAACDVLCVPSRGESFGMVYFEAFAYQKPVVGLNLPALRETIGMNEAGFLVEGSPEEIANAVSYLLGNSGHAQKMGKNGLMLTLQHSWEVAVNSYLFANQKN